MKLRQIGTSLALTAGIFSSGVVLADHLDPDGLLRKDDGSIHLMNQYQALGIDSSGQALPAGPACPTATHLPTARELAMWSQSKGAQGVWNSAQPAPSGYYIVDARNPDATEDKFYFNYTGYSVPQGDLTQNMFWTSSLDLFDSSESDVAYVLDGSYGDIYAGVPRLNLNAVLCIANP